MAEKIQISPITRINGFWDIEILVDNGRIQDAWSSGIFFRGFEEILKGRDPRDAAYLTERICGICSTAHAIASSRAIENALGIKIPDNAILLRNLSFAADMLQNHIRHFYLLTVVDYIKGPDKPPFVPRYEGGYKCSPQQTERLLDSYNRHFEFARMTHEMVTIFGGKAPHQHGIIAGGATANPSVDKIQKFMSMLDKVLEFVTTRMIPDMETLARVYEEYYKLGRGYGNLLAFGNFAIPGKMNEFVMPFGVFTEGKINPFDPEKIREHVHNAWYKQAEPTHPTEEKTEPDPDKEGGYSWVKAPRYDGRPFETNPIAHLWMMGEYRNGISVIDRMMARVLEAKLVAGYMKQWLKELRPGLPVYQPFSMPDKEVEGVGYTGAMRGALSHWVRFKGKKILNYQIVTPSAWVCSPRDDRGNRGPVEEALVGTPIADIKNPIEVGRVARSFDPCLACAVHIIKPNGEILRFQV